MNILITGPNGFIAKHLINYLSSFSEFNLLTISRDTSDLLFRDILSRADFVVHLAGVNRPKKIEDFETCNFCLTKKIADNLIDLKKSIPIYFSSSIHAIKQTDYGISKKKSEDLLNILQKVNGNKVIIDRLSRVFGPGAKPNYNSLIATICHNGVNNLPTSIHDKNEVIEVIYIDDLIKSIHEKIKGEIDLEYQVYKVSLGDLNMIINNFRENKFFTGQVDPALVEKIYKTYCSYQNE